jgi:flavin-dependent dehydrogenase
LLVPGPAGSSAAIHLGRSGLRVLLAEQKKFPRAKLCGEFISPECQQHFENLGLTDAITTSRPAALTETVFYSTARTSRRYSEQLVWQTCCTRVEPCSDGQLLLRRAQACGVVVLENASVTEPILDGTRCAAA